ncbi:MAG TPA: site-specific integrase [Acidimicrobiales bacterium]|nr:site-specific integrase [Acidimicrobiales bacterium]
MAGNVYKHGNGWKAVIVDGYGRGAKRRTIGTFRLKADALDELRKAEVEVMTGTFVDRQLGKVSLVERMAADIERRSDRAHNTTIAALNALGHVKAFFGTKSIASVRHSDVQAFVSGLDLAPSTVEVVFGHLKATIRSAMADGVLGRDPTLKVKLPKGASAAMVIPTDAEVERLFDAAPDGFGAAIILGAGCGLRAQEAAGIVAEDVDFLRRVIHVRQQFHGRLGRFEDLKDHETRDVPVDDHILDALALHIGEHGLGEHGVVVHYGGVPQNAARFTCRWTQTKKHAGGMTLKFHALRHHYSSTAISAGVSIPMLSKALGHSKPSITLDVYSHLLVGDDDRLRGAATVRFGARETA